MTPHFSWDSRKVAGNRRKHGVRFQEAATNCESSVLDSRPGENGRTMKMADKPRAAKRRAGGRRTQDTLRPEYDFHSGVRGKYAKSVGAGTNLVLLDADVAAEFKSARAVNRALREYLKTRAK
jgi:hypothetical protein